jgi:hydroxyacylglutathione hydrolase
VKHFIFSRIMPVTHPLVQILRIPAFEDNYLWLIHNESDAVVVDPGDPTPILRTLDELDLHLTAILCTHHHGDHVGGNLTLMDHCGPLPIFGPANEPIPGRTVAVQEGDVLDLTVGSVEVLSVPGHTRGHLAYRLGNALFCGDTLFALGCGRLFEGSAEDMWTSLQKLRALPEETAVYCAHEYTLANLAFARHVDPENPELKARALIEEAKRQHQQPTVPSSLARERQTNPFLRADEAALRESAERWAGRPLDTPLEVFATLREWKNNFKAPA